MAEAALPNWVYDLVAELDRQEDIHPTLYVQPAGSDGYRQYDWCPKNALDLVPTDVRKRARVIASYKAADGGDA